MAIVSAAVLTVAVAQSALARTQKPPLHGGTGWR